MVPVLREDGCSTNLIDVSRGYIRLQPRKIPAECGRVPDVAGDESADLSVVLNRLRHRHRGAFRQSPVIEGLIYQTSQSFVKLNWEREKME